jgi:hypothetical protein
MSTRRILKTPGLLVAYLAVCSSMLLVSNNAAATPSFARQMSMECGGCHFQSFPALNEFGRQFRATGYTEARQEKGDMVEGTGLSIPAGLNTSVITKLRYTKVGSATPEIDFPDELALMVAGRASENIGYLFELAMVTEPTAGSKHSALAGGKVHFNVGKAGNTRFSLVPFTTDGSGAGYGFELLNTGAQKSQRIIENGEGYSASMRLGLGHAAATGLTLAGTGDNYFLNMTLWTPGWNDAGLDPSSFANYLRFGYFPKVAGWDTAVGVQVANGTAVTNGGATSSKTDAWVVDGQMQGKLGERPLGLYASYGSAAAGNYALSNTSDRNAYGLLAKLGFGHKDSLFAAYAASGGDVSESSNTLGIQHMLAQNAKLELYTSDDAGVRTTRLMLFAGF